MTNLLISIFGANYKTSITAIGTALFAALTWLSAVSYETSPLALVIPPAYKSKVQYIAGIATLLLWIWNGIAQKSKEVTGGTIGQDEQGRPAARPAMPPIHTHVKKL